MYCEQNVWNVVSEAYCIYTGNKKIYNILSSFLHNVLNDRHSHLVKS